MLSFVRREGVAWLAKKLQLCKLSLPSQKVAEPVYGEPIQEPLVGSTVRDYLSHELTELYNKPPIVSATVGADRVDHGNIQVQVMPFHHGQAASYYYHSQPSTVTLAGQVAACCQRHWEHRSVDERCQIIEKAASLMAGVYRQRITAAAMIGQGMTAIQAEYNICQLVDYLRSACYFMRELTKHPYVSEGLLASNSSQYHGLEGFWAAITPADSFAHAAHLAITPLITGNCVVWKPSDYSVLTCHRIFECLKLAGVPSGVINFVPAEKNSFLDTVCSASNLAGISFGGSSSTLEHIWQMIGDRITTYESFPRVVGTGSGKNFHVVHSTADLTNAVSCTVRAAFEMAGQKAYSCSRVFVAQAVLDRFMNMLVDSTKSLFVTHPLDHRCFTSALLSEDAFDKVEGFMQRAEEDSNVSMKCGGRTDKAVGFYVEPTVYLVPDFKHELMCREVRGPLLSVCPFPEENRQGLQQAVATSPYALTGSIFAQDEEWIEWAVSALRHQAPMLVVNGRCSEERPAQQSVGGARKSGTGAKAGSISYLLHYCTERSLREELHPCDDLAYSYMLEVPQHKLV